MSKIIDSTQSDFEAVVLKSAVPVLVDFWAPWCGPCVMMAPVLESYAGDMDGKVRVVKVNVDEPANQALAAQYQIRSIPNMKLFKAGKVVHEVVGLRSKADLAAELAKALG
ncbi:MAG: thioredoxin [Patescibacteria group bacterium]|nr:thioredoxin [Patescibacteria group bacterium]